MRYLLKTIGSMFLFSAIGVGLAAVCMAAAEGFGWLR